MKCSVDNVNYLAQHNTHVHGCEVVPCVLFHSDMISLITSAPILIFEVQAENAIGRWLDVLGPTDSATARATHPSSIRARFGTGELWLLLQPKILLAAGVGNILVITELC